MNGSDSGAAPSSGATDGVIALVPGAPARVTAVAAPIVAVALVAWRAVQDGLRAASDDPVSPWVIAVVTVAVGAWLGWRALTQWTELRRNELRCRNLVSRFAVDWDRVESLVVVRRGPVVAIDVRIRGHRRRLRLGAATRFRGDTADAVLDMFRAHPDARRLLLDDANDFADGAADGAADGVSDGAADDAAAGLDRRGDRPSGEPEDDRTDGGGSGPDPADH